eukprot:359740-Chlamydomonas_euryale.AAC.10
MAGHDAGVLTVFAECARGLGDSYFGDIFGNQVGVRWRAGTGRAGEGRSLGLLLAGRRNLNHMKGQLHVAHGGLSTGAWRVGAGRWLAPMQQAQATLGCMAHGHMGAARWLLGV